MRDNQYEDLLARVRSHGSPKGDRTGTGTLSVFGAQLRYDLSQGFPLITTKRVHFRSVALELLWFLRGELHVHWLQDQGCTIWNEWADKNGYIGPLYGWQWRRWGTDEDDLEGVDQIAAVIESLRTNPNSRRHVVSAWNVGELPDMALAPCHALFQFDVTDGRLSCQVYQRSADLFLGVPFNIASYALLTHMVAQQTGLTPGDLIWTGGDCHIYSNHTWQVAQQLTRAAKPFPTLTLQPADSIDDYTLEHIEVVGYDPHPPIKAPVAV